MSNSSNPISTFFKTEVAPATNTAIGIAYAEHMVATLKRDHADMNLEVLRGYLTAWNERSGSLFTDDFITKLAQVMPLRKTHKPQHPCGSDSIDMFNES